MSDAKYGIERVVLNAKGKPVNRKKPRGRPFGTGPDNPRHRSGQSADPTRSKQSDPNYDYKKDPNSLRRLAEEAGLDPD